MEQFYRAATTPTKNKRGNYVTILNEKIEARPRINLPEGDFDAVLLGAHHEMICAWTAIVTDAERAVLGTYGESQGKPVSDTVGALSYASVARVAWSLASVARIKEGEFDPVEFGKRCEAIAREQIDRYRLVAEQAGSA